MLQADNVGVNAGPHGVWPRVPERDEKPLNYSNCGSTDHLHKLLAANDLRRVDFLGRVPRIYH